MIKLSNRLKCIADQITGTRIADIGTDHGYLPIYLLQKKSAEFVILADVNKGPLDRARRNLEAEQIFGKFDLRLGNGLAPIKQKEVETIVIAGMGGVLMTEILGADLQKAYDFHQLILQPRNAQDFLRKWLSENGFVIENETLVQEGIYICEILTVIPGDVNLPISHPMEYEISPMLFEKKDPLLKEMLLRKIRVEEKILENLTETKTDQGAQKREHTIKRLAYFKDKLEEVIW